MASYHGKAGEAHWKPDGGAFAQLTEVQSWSATVTCGTAEDTAMTAANYGKTRKAGFKGGTCSVTCLVTGDADIDRGDTGEIELLRTGTNADGGYQGDAICTGVETGVGMDDVETITYSFTFTGEVTDTVTTGV